MTQGLVDVAAAVIEQADGRFLLTQRPVGKVYEGYWEFPGGKVEPGESVAEALDRELREELGIDVQLAYPWITRVYTYRHATVKLHFYRVVSWRGDPHPRENQSLAWQCNRDLTVSPILPANAPILKALSLPTRLGITCASELGISGALTKLQRALAGGLRLVQVREPNLDPGVRKDFAARVTAGVRKVNGIVMINSDIQLAMALGAGLHLPSKALLSTLSRPDFEWCSASCHNVEELAKAGELGLDFVLLGPVKPTPSHVDSPALGWSNFANMIRSYPLPVFALGGLRPCDLDQARRAGAHGIALMRAAWASD
ncbi:MAG: Nudix family hydrolase [Betaproteobacteria bacterium]